MAVIRFPNKTIGFHQWLVGGITFLAYASLHASRKPPSIVKSVLGPPTSTNGTNPDQCLDSSQKGWAPFNDPKHGTQRLGELDLAFLFFYAVGMFFSGQIADNINLNLFLGSGMLLSGAFTIAFGCGYWFDIHNFWYFVIVQALCGLSQSTGWPSVIAVMGNWYGKTKRGFIMGLWNSHTSVGNILGSFIASSMLNDGRWGWSFFLPGVFVIFMAIMVFLFLAVSPQVLGLSLLLVNGNVVGLEAASSNERSTRGVDSGEGEDSSLIPHRNSESREANAEVAIRFWEACMLPGVRYFAACLFFSKLVAYTFLYWLPFYLTNIDVGGKHLKVEVAGNLSIAFDVGGVLGGILVGVISDWLEAQARTSVAFLVFSIPALFLYRVYGSSSMLVNGILMFISGILVNGPYSLISTAVAADLGTSDAQNKTRALATVTAILDGAGSIGAAIGPCVVGYISPSSPSDWNFVFGGLYVALLSAALCLVPAVRSERNRSEDQQSETADSPPG